MKENLKYYFSQGLKIGLAIGSIVAIVAFIYYH